MKKYALVTGCSRGIGREIALELARDGYNIIGTYNTNLSDIDSLKSRIESIGVEFNYFKLDLSNNYDIDNLYNNIKDINIDILINNAAISLDNPFELKTKDEFMKVLEINLVGPFLLIQKLKDNLIGSIIINIASTDGINTYSTLNMDYSASKAGLINLTKSLALQLKDNKVYALCPNWVDTESIREMSPDYLKEEMLRVGQYKLIDPKDVAKKVLEIIDNNIDSGSIIIMES